MKNIDSKASIFGRIAGWWRSLHLIDRLLLIFMVILLSQSAHSLFFHESAMQDPDALNSVIRTTAASIFGYFISSGFQSAASKSAASAQTGIGFPMNQNESEQPTGQNSFTAKAQAEADNKPQTGTTIGHRNNLSGQRLRQQMIIVAMVGLSSLLMLVVACNYTSTCPDSVATLSQLRDFVSGSVGFLIGHAGTVRTIS